jgi:hypothetical protein
MLFTRWGGRIVPRGKAGLVPLAAATCCLVLAATGCNLHRTGHGYILRSQWSLECGDMGYVPSSCAAGQCETCGDCSACSPDPAKPEILPWRTCLKTRIGDRLFRRGGCGECEIKDCPDGDNGKPVTPKRPIQSAPLPAASPIPPEKPNLPEELPPPVKTTDLEIPKTDFQQPDCNRPDVVME